MPGELPGQCKFLPRVKGESGSHGPLHRILPRGQLPSFPAALGSGGYLCGVGGGSGQGPTMTSFRVSPQELDCFIIDNNGFILVSERPQEVRYREAELGRGRVLPQPGQARKGLRSSLGSGWRTQSEESASSS